MGFLNETVCVWCKSKNSQSGLKYFESGDACFESAFLFNKYFKNEGFSNESLSLIELRIKGKYNFVKNSSSISEDLYKHYKNFLSNIKKVKKFNSIEN